MERSSNRPDRIASNLVAAALGRNRRDGGESWFYGWSVQSYRRSEAASVQIDKDSHVHFSPEAVTALEEAVNALLRKSALRNAWEAGELWGVIANLVASLPFDADEAEFSAEIDQRIELMSKPGPSFVGFPLANVAWAGPPVVVGDLVIGRIDRGWLASVQAAASGRPVPTEADHIPWLQGVSFQVADNSPAPLEVAVGSWQPAYGEKARKLARVQLDDLLGLLLLLRHEHENPDLHPLRGDSHRPGVRGLAIHRPTLRELAETGNAAVGRELAAQIFHASRLQRGVVVNWFGEDPFPLEQLLSAPQRTEAVQQLLSDDTAVHRRIRLAARWYAKAHWANDTEDAVLALGIALDALIGDRSGLPTRVLADRFALLEPIKQNRAGRAQHFGVLYGARSGVAHGGRPSEIDDFEFIRGMFASVGWAAAQLLSLVSNAGLSTDDQYIQLFESLKWGTTDPWNAAAIDTETT